MKLIVKLMALCLIVGATSLQAAKTRLKPEQRTVVDLPKEELDYINWSDNEDWI